MFSFEGNMDGGIFLSFYFDGFTFKHTVILLLYITLNGNCWFESRFLWYMLSKVMVCRFLLH